MPYGIPEEKGGDSTTNVARMEECVTSVMNKEGVDKVTAIKRCKKSLGFTKDGK